MTYTYSSNVTANLNSVHIVDTVHTLHPFSSTSCDSGPATPAGNRQ